MGLGVLEPVIQSGHHVPGTVLLDTHTTSAEVTVGLEAAHLKRGTGRNSELILVPQPSDDPNDPLNWPLWQRDAILALYCFCTLCCIGGVGPILSSIALPIIMDLKTDFTGVSLLTGYQLCTVGAVAVLVSALARKFGKRPCLLVSISLSFAGTLWGGFAKTYGSLVGARVVQGLGIAMFESVTYAVIGDMYHVHQRGTRMTIYILSQSGISQLPTVVAGRISVELSWRWVFYLLDIFLGLAWLLSILFGWETMFNRSAVYNLDTSSRDKLDQIMDGEKSVTVDEVENRIEPTPTASTGRNMTRETLVQRMRPFHGTFTDEPIWKMIVRPFFLLANPTVLWSIIIISFTTVWFIITNFVIAQAFSGPPYLLTTAQIGYMSIGPMIGGILGCIACGFICDPLARYLTKRNNGVYEPEFRLPMMIVVPIVSTIGYFLFGNLIQQGQAPIASSAVFGLVFVSVQFAGVSTGAYIVDAFRESSVEIFVISMSVKNFVFFGFTYVLNDWFAAWGPAKMFNTIAGVQLALSLTTIPIYLYGKRIRAWWHAHDFLTATKL